MKPNPAMLFASAILIIASGCSTSLRSPAKKSRKSRTSVSSKAHQHDVNALAAYYLGAGLASDMGAALQLARDYYWFEVTEERGLLGKQEAQMDRIREEAQNRQRK